MSNTDPTKYLGEPRYTGRVKKQNTTQKTNNMRNREPTKYLGEPWYTGRVRQTKHNTEN
jgi:hypothetical protein